MGYLLGVDPGFASVGLAVVRLHPDGEEVAWVGVLRTEKSARKRQVRASDDNVRRAREIARDLRRVRAAWPALRVVCAESMSFPRHAGSAAKMAMCWGVLAGFTDYERLPLVQASPQEVKRAVCGRRDAPKERVALALQDRYPDVRALPSLAAVPASQREHAYDALAACVACLDSEVVRLLRAEGQPTVVAAGCG